MNCAFIHLNGLLFALSKALDFVESEFLGVASNHGKRVAYVCMRIGRALGFSDEEVFDLGSCAVLHDNALASYMLYARINNFSQLENLKLHCAEGEENVKNFPFLTDVSGVILHHHENWDGSGFHGLQGDDIPLKASLVRVANGIDLAMRPGDARIGLEQGIREHVARFKGTHYSPRITEAVLDILDERTLRALSHEHINESLAGEMPQVGRALTTKELLEVCCIFARIIDSKSRFTQTHSRGIAEKAAFMGKLFGFDREHCDTLKIAGYLHDVGKLSTPLSVLEKPGPLSEEEFAIMKGHLNMTREILQSVKGLEQISRWAGNHHERLDGSGYCQGCGHGELDFESRLLACCDVYQALIEDRPYRKGMPHLETMRVLNKLAETGQLDKDIVSAFDKGGESCFGEEC